MPMNPRLLRPMARGGFTPKSISGLALWLDFADTSSVTLDANSKISAITDKSGNNFNGTQTTAASRLGISTQNGRQCANNGTSSNNLHVLFNPVADTSNWRHSFVCAVWDAGGTTFPGFNSPFSAIQNGGTGNGSVMLANSGTNLLFGVGPVMHSTNPASSRWRFNGGSYTTSTLTFPYFNGTPFVLNGDYRSAVGIRGYSIGADRPANNSDRGWRGRICEVISYNVSLSDSAAASVEKYLAAKWGFTLA